MQQLTTHETPRFRHKKLYEQVYDLLKARIESGEWRIDQPITNEVDLAKELQISIGTLRKARQLLKDDGLIDLRPGRGTMVLDHKANEEKRKQDCRGKAMAIIQEAMDEGEAGGRSRKALLDALEAHISKALFEARAS